jgi:hypothetical protein
LKFDYFDRGSFEQALRIADALLQIQSALGEIFQAFGEIFDLLRSFFFASSYSKT